MKRNLVCTLLLVLFASVLVFLWSFTAPVPVKNDVRAILSDDYFDWYRNEARTVRYNGEVFTTRSPVAIPEDLTDLSLISASVAIRWEQEQIDGNVTERDEVIYYFMQTEDGSALFLVPHELRRGILGDAPRPFAFFLVRAQA